MSGPFTPAMLVVGVLDSGGLHQERAAELLCREFGPVDWVSKPQPFVFTDYYRAEMGEDLRRNFIAMGNLVDPARLASIKRTTNRLEAEIAAALGRNGRPVNLDPGLLFLSRFILATTKDHAHRIPLDSGIYAEVTLIYRRGRYEALPWTYPDYAGDAYKEVFETLRERYAARLREA